MDFRHLIVTCLFSMLRLPFDNQKVKENYAIFWGKCTCVFLKAEYVPGNPFISVRTIPFSLRFLTRAYVRARTNYIM